MQKIILIEDDNFTRDRIINCLGLSFFNEDDCSSCACEEKCKEMKHRLEEERFVFEEFVTNQEVHEKYREGIPTEALIVLDGDLKDGSTEKIFELFSEEAKTNTLVHNSGYGYACDFSFWASKDGFKNFCPKEEAFNRLGDILREMSLKLITNGERS